MITKEMSGGYNGKILRVTLDGRVNFLWKGVRENVVAGTSGYVNNVSRSILHKIKRG